MSGKADTTCKGWRFKQWHLSPELTPGLQTLKGGGLGLTSAIPPPGFL